jgi:hypothetical protein
MKIFPRKFYGKASQLRRIKRQRTSHGAMRSLCTTKNPYATRRRN